MTIRSSGQATITKLKNAIQSLIATKANKTNGVSEITDSNSDDYTNIASMQSGATQQTINDSVNIELGKCIKKSQTSGLIKNDGTVDTSSKENTSNKVSSWSGTVTNDHYPSEKLVKDSLDGKIDLAGGVVPSNFVLFDEETNIPIIESFGVSGIYAFNNMLSLDIANATTTYNGYELATLNDIPQIDLSNYLTTSSASSTYLTQSSASSTYLTQSSASSTYIPLSARKATVTSGDTTGVPSGDAVYNMIDAVLDNIITQLRS